MEEKLDKIMQDMQKTLSTRRFNHSIGVMRKARELAKIYNIDEDEAGMTGLAHDIAKEMKKEDIVKYIKENNIKADDIELKNLDLLHGKIGADICRKKYNFTDEMCNAIANHTTGELRMTKFDKIILLADKLEEGRNWQGIDEIRQIACEDLDLAIIKIIDRAILECVRKQKQIHSKSIYIRNELIQKYL